MSLGAFNQEKALVGAFSVIVKLVVEPMENYTALILGVSVIKKFGTCYFLVFFAFFINISNRLLTIAIVAYRYVFVLKNWLVATPAQRRVFSSLILLFILLPSLLLTGVAVHYRDYWLRFLSRTSTSTRA